MDTPIRTVYILGAGASASAGFPVASTMLAAIRGLASRLSNPDSVNLRAACEETADLIERERCRTIDELAWKTRANADAHFVRQAKAVTTALFLDLERTADLGPYRRAAQTMITFSDLALPDEGRMRVPTSAVCLDYNYDRCLPRAIYHEIAASAPSRRRNMEGRAQRLLNSGFNTFSERFEDIDRNRFALLKMHGQVGARLDSETDDEQIQGVPLDDFGLVQVDDRILDWFGPRSPGQMLFFPWETRLPKPIVDLRARIEAAAGSFLADATQIKVAGFSFHDANTKVLEPLLSTASCCRVIDVYDPSPEVLARVKSLVARHRLGIDVIPHERWDP